MADYPDGTYPVDIIAQSLDKIAVDVQKSIQLNVDIVAQTLSTMAVDIAAQTLATLGVNIKAQDLANLKVDVAAQTLSELGVNITAQDLSELVIKIAAQTVGVYLQPEWAAKEGEDKNFHSSGNVTADGGSVNVTYTVPTGKTLYIGGLSTAIYAQDIPTDYDHFLYNQCGIAVAGTNIAGIGGLGGTLITFQKPIVANAGEEIIALSVNRSNIACWASVSVWGYEI